MTSSEGLGAAQALQLQGTAPWWTTCREWKASQTEFRFGQVLLMLIVQGTNSGVVVLAP